MVAEGLKVKMDVTTRWIIVIHTRQFSFAFVQKSDRVRLMFITVIFSLKMLRCSTKALKIP